MKPNTYHYFKLSKINSQHSLVFDGLAEFNRFVELQQLKTIFIVPDETGEPAYFAVTHKGGLLQQATMGFKKLEDYVTATHKKFPDATAFYMALEQGYTEYEDFLLVSEAGIDDKLVFEKIKAAGFVAGFKEYQSQLKDIEGVPDIGLPHNAHRLYEYALKNGFENYAAFKNAFTKGFKDADTYNIATTRGFSSLHDYTDAQQRGILNYPDLEFARQHNLRNHNDVTRFIDLENLQHTGCSHDQRVLLILLSKLEPGKKISINKLYDLLEKEIEQYCYADTNQMAPWFLQQFTGRQSVIDFMLNSDHVKQYGTYDNDGEFFEINHLKDRNIVIDGSNIAHNSNGNDKSKPYYSNIIKVVLFLKQKGFTEITVMTDASLRHRVADADNLNQLKSLAEYLEAPKETQADIFIISHVKKNHCQLVSNDNFRDWKLKDSWVAQYIDFYRLTFMIKGDEVIMPDLH